MPAQRNPAEGLHLPESLDLSDVKQPFVKKFPERIEQTPLDIAIHMPPLEPNEGLAALFVLTSSSISYPATTSASQRATFVTGRSAAHAAATFCISRSASFCVLPRACCWICVNFWTISGAGRPGTEGRLGVGWGSFFLFYTFDKKM